MSNLKILLENKFQETNCDDIRCYAHSTAQVLNELGPDYTPYLNKLSGSPGLIKIIARFGLVGLWTVGLVLISQDKIPTGYGKNIDLAIASAGVLTSLYDGISDIIARNRFEKVIGRNLTPEEKTTIEGIIKKDIVVRTAFLHFIGGKQDSKDTGVLERSLGKEVVQKLTIIREEFLVIGLKNPTFWESAKSLAGKIKSVFN